VLLTACSVAFGGLAVLSPDPRPDGPAVVALAGSAPAPLAVADGSRDELLDEARASRSRRASADAVARAEAAAAEAKAKAEADERARAEDKARAEAEAAAQARAEAEAKAKAAKAAAAKAAAAKRPAAAAPAPTGRGNACPVPNASFTDTWGAPRSGGRSHRGTDLLAPYGSPVYAVVPGRIRTASSSLGGISLYLQGDNGETYFYAHNSANVARTGQRVSAGELIARVGSTGNAGGTNHVHFERQVGGRSVNPYQFLRGLC
jgi:murein DD-endopeptidase MepM/ murein hydrolase activator NlpD